MEPLNIVIPDDIGGGEVPMKKQNEKLQRKIEMISGLKGRASCFCKSKKSNCDFEN